MRRHISPSERVAIFARADGRCHICGEKIGVSDAWDVDHVIPLAMGGDEAKGSANLQPAHVACHAEKTPADVGAIAKAKRVSARHVGASAPRNPLPGGRRSKWKKKINGECVPR